MNIKPFVLIPLVLCIMVCCYIAYSSIEKPSAGQAVTVNVTRVSPTIDPAANATASPYPIAANATTAAPSPTVTANSSDSGSVIRPDLPPAVLFTHVPAAGSDDIVTGTITGVNPSRYRLAIYIYVYGLFNVPSGSDPLTAINSDGSWTCNISDGGMGDRATEIDAYLVPANFSAPILSGRQYATNAIKDATVACNSVALKPAKT